VKTDQRDRNRYLGGTVPFGWQVGPAGALVEDPTRQRAIRRMVKLAKQGDPYVPLQTL
jgi:putative DNA-invertase from lambdoid prophage Rac